MTNKNNKLLKHTKKAASLLEQELTDVRLLKDRKEIIIKLIGNLELSNIKRAFFMGILFSKYKMNPSEVI